MRQDEVKANDGKHDIESVSKRIAALEAEVDRLRGLLEECDIFLRIHAKPENELKRDVQQALAEGGA